MIKIILFTLVLFCIICQFLIIDKMKMLLLERIEINKKRTQINIDYLHQRIDNLEKLIKGMFK
jgi:cell division protein FtsL